MLRKESSAGSSPRWAKPRLLSTLLACAVGLLAMAVSQHAQAQTVTINARGANSAWSTTLAGTTSGTWGTSSAKSSITTDIDTARPGTWYPASAAPVQTPTPMRWRVRPTLTATGTWQVYVTHPPTTASTTIVVGLAVTNATGLPATSTVFQSANGNTWELVGTMVASTTQPTIEFFYSSGACGSSARWYLDAIKFVYVPTVATRTWDGGGTDDLFSNADNWDGAAPVAGDGVAFDGSTRLTPSFNASLSLSGLRFSSGAGAFTISAPGAEVMTLTGSMTNSSSNPQIISVPLTISGSTTVINTGADGITLSGGTVAASGFTKAGAGTLTLQGGTAPNLNGLTVAAGTVLVNASEQIANTALVDVATGATLQIVGGATETIKRVAIDGLSTATPRGTIDLGANSQLTMAADGGFTGVNSGSAIQITGAAGSVFTLTGGELRWTPQNMVNTFEKLVVGTGATLRIAHGGNAWNGADTSLGAVPASFMQDQITINGGMLGLNGGDLVNPIVLNANRGLTISGTATIETLVDAVIPGAITGSGILLHNGGRNLALDGLNDFSGGLNLGAGSVTISSASSVGTGPVAFTTSGATLIAAAEGITVTNHLNLSAVVNNVFGGSTNITFSGDVNLGDTGSSPQLNVTNAATTMTFTGSLTNTLGLVKTGSGKVSLTGVNTYGGATTNTGGTLGISQEASVSANPIVLNAATAVLNADETLTLTAARPIEIGASGGALAASATKTLTVNSDISGAGVLTISGPGSVVFGGNNTWSGGTKISAGAAYTVVGTEIPNGGSLTVDGALNLGTTSRDNTTLAGAGSIDLGSATLTLNGTGNSTFSGSVSGTGGIYKSGTGVLTLTGINTFSGGLTLDNARINFNSTTAESAGSGTISVIGNSTISGSLSGAILTNTISLGSGAIATIFSTSGDLNIASYITGAGSLLRTNTGSGTVTLSASNDFSGGVKITDRTLRLANAYALGTGALTIGDETTAPTSTINLQSTVALTGVDAITNDITVNQNFTLGGASDLEFASAVTLATTPTVTVSSSAATHFSGIISGAFGLTKAGSGTLTLSGANAYTGLTTISAGTLSLSGSLAGDVAVNGGILAGGGTITGDVAVNTGGTISAGTSPGMLTTGDLTWNGGGTNVVEVNNATGDPGADPGWDAIAVNGTLTIGATPGDKFVIDLRSLTGSNVPGQADNFSISTPYTWKIVTTTGGITGFDQGAFEIRTNDFVGASTTGGFTLVQNGNDIEIHYSDVNPPIITVQPPPTQLKATGSEVTIGATVIGTEPITYVWKKNTFVVNNGPNVSGADTATLTLSNVTSADDGSYVLEASNTADTDISDASVLTVIDAPAITVEPVGGTINSGGSIVLSVTATGGGTLTYQWKKGINNVTEGGNYSGSQSSSLTISTAVIDDSGTYTVVVDNGAGSDTSADAVVVVQEAPVITVQPQDTAVASGATAQFTVTATGNPLEYQWKKNGVDISGATDSSYSVTANSGSVGFYAVVVSNVLGVVVSDSAQLTLTGGGNELLFEDFDSYANQAALEANWTDGVAPGVTLTSAQADSAPNSGEIGTAAARSDRTITTTGTASAANAITFSFDYYDSDSTAAPYRNYAGLRDGFGTSAGQIVQMGLANTLTGNNYMAQVQGHNGNAFFKLDDVGAPTRITGWRNLKAVITDTEIKFYIDGILSKTITNPQARSYTRVTLGSGFSSTKAANYDNVTVSVPSIAPTITADPQNAVANYGASAQFSVTATGTAPLSYQWQKDNVDILGENGSTLTLSSVETADEGTYSVIVLNSAGSVTSAGATLTVNDPFISVQPVGGTFNYGDNHTLSVTADGAPALTYQWMKDGVDIGGANSSSLALTGLNNGNEGSYTVAVTNSLGDGLVSDAAVIAVTDPIITLQPVNVTVGPGSNAVFTAAAAGSTSVTYQWQRGGIDISLVDPHYSGADTASLTVVGADNPGDHLAQFSVTVTGGDIVNSGSATLTVREIPVITIEPQGITNNAGDTVSFSVTATGDALTYQWYSNNVALVDDLIHTGGAQASTLTLTNILAADRGTYKVVVANEAGSDTSADAELGVIEPYVVTQPQSESVNAGSDVTFSVTANGTGLTYQWMKDGADIGGANGSSLTLNYVTNANEGSYTVAITNALNEGVVSSAASLIVADPYIETHPVGQQLATNGTISLSVLAHGTGLTYQWRTNGGNIVGAIGATYTKTLAKQTNSGLYSVVVTGADGSVTSSDAEVIVDSIAKITLQPPKTTKKLVGQTALLTVKATGSNLKYQWKQEGVDIVGATTSAYSINPIPYSYYDNGNGGTNNYTVVVSNAFFSTISSNAALIVTNEIVKPTASVVFPVAGRGYTNDVDYNLAINGKATDNARVESVWISINGSDFAPATINSNGPSILWSTNITMQPGTNELRVYSIDYSTNISKTLTNKFFHNVWSDFGLLINSTPSVPDDHFIIKSVTNATFGTNNGLNKLLVGRPYQLTIVQRPTNGYIFTNWTFTSESNASPAELQSYLNTNTLVLKYIMRSNMVLTANYVTNQFRIHQGVYNGLVAEADETRHRSAGYISLRVTETMAVSGSLLLEGDTMGFSGKLNINGATNLMVKRFKTKAKTDLTLQLAVDIVGDTESIVGNVIDVTNGWTAPFTARRQIYGRSWERNETNGFVTNFFSTAYSNAYTMALQGFADTNVGPAGWSHASVLVNHVGVIKAAGKTADGQPISQSTTLSKDGDWPFFVQLYVSTNDLNTNLLSQPKITRRRGMMIGLLGFETNNAPPLDLNTNLAPLGSVTWIKTGWTNAAWTAGFTNDAIDGVPVKSSVHIPRITYPNLLYTGETTNYVATMSEGGVEGFQNLFYLKTNNNLFAFNNKNTNGGPSSVEPYYTNRFTINLVNRLGTLTGNFTNANNKSVPWSGVMLQDYTNGFGFFINTNLNLVGPNSGAVVITNVPAVE